MALDPGRQFACEADAQYRRHGGAKRFAAHRKRNVKTAGSDRQHSQRAGRGRVTVGAQQGFAGPAEALHVHDMTDAVAGARVPQAKAATGALQEKMIVRVQMIDLQQVVIDILRAEFATDSIEADRFQRQHHQRSGRILGERLIDVDRDRLAWTHLSVNKVGRDQFLSDIVWHIDSLSDCDVPASRQFWILIFRCDT